MGKKDWLGYIKNHMDDLLCDLDRVDDVDISVNKEFCTITISYAEKPNTVKIYSDNQVVSEIVNPQEKHTL